MLLSLVIQVWLLLLSSFVSTAFTLYMNPNAAAAAMSASRLSTAKKAGVTAALTQSDYKAKLHDNHDHDISSSSITSKDVATLPKPGTSTPASFQFVAEDQLAYLVAPNPTQQLTRQLFVVDLKTSETMQVSVGRQDQAILEERVLSFLQQLLNL